jgi:P27 family predicted phage terminase small subunit
MTDRTPTRLKAIRGTERADRKPAEPPRSPETTIPDPPEWLDANGQSKWKQLVPELASRRLLTGTGLSLLEVLCEAWSDYRGARDVIRASGASYASKKGEEGKGDTMMRRRPEVDQARDAGKQYASLLARFEKLIEGVEPVEKMDPMDQLLEGRRGRRSAAG